MERVQGVGFHYFTLKQAQNLNTESWVRNNPIGNVEAFARGIYLQQGPSFYRMDDMKLIWEYEGRIIQIFPLSNKCNSKNIFLLQIGGKK